MNTKETNQTNYGIEITEDDVHSFNQWFEKFISSKELHVSSKFKIVITSVFYEGQAGIKIEYFEPEILNKITSH